MRDSKYTGLNSTQNTKIINLKQYKTHAFFGLYFHELTLEFNPIVIFCSNENISRSVLNPQMPQSPQYDHSKQLGNNTIFLHPSSNFRAFEEFAFDYMTNAAEKDFRSHFKYYD